MRVGGSSAQWSNTRWSDEKKISVKMKIEHVFMIYPQELVCFRKSENSNLNESLEFMFFIIVDLFRENKKN